MGAVAGIHRIVDGQAGRSAITDCDGQYGSGGAGKRMVYAAGPVSIAQMQERCRTLGAAAFAAELLRRFRDHEPSGAVVEFDGERLEEAFATSLEQGGPLSGVAICLKDNIDAPPFETRCASPALKGNRPVQDANVVARLREAGAVIAAKTNMHELSFGVTTNNAACGPARNPFDAERVAGGSSGGSGVAVALGLAPVALGTDTGGSVRIPAAFCGIYGFRPSTGRYPSDGVLILSETRDTVGILAANCEDIARIDAFLASQEAGGVPEQRPDRLRIGVFEDAAAGLCPKVDAVVSAAIEHLADQDVTLCRIDGKEFADLDERIGNAIVFVEAERYWQALAGERGTDLAGFAKDVASPDVRAVFAQLPELAAVHRTIAEHALSSERPRLRSRLERLFEEQDLDAVLGATVPVQPPFVGDDEEMSVAGRGLPVFRTLTRNSALASVLGMPSLTVPAGFDADGLPVGLQIEALPGRDLHLLQAACEIDLRLRGWREAKKARRQSQHVTG